MTKAPKVVYRLITLYDVNTSLAHCSVHVDSEVQGSSLDLALSTSLEGIAFAYDTTLEGIDFAYGTFCPVLKLVRWLLWSLQDHQ